MAREIAGVVANPLEGLEHEGGLERHLEAPLILHRPGQQAPQARAVLRIELVIPGEDLGCQLPIQAVESLQQLLVELRIIGIDRGLSLRAYPNRPVM